ncbi:PREDICTED: uncharacterized protein LOC106111599 [Papilio polytes]|uniref:uncharacterized protein LOC106111599 n=1 Tax=Papilio polytes TaxID=76194 RepID=UPI0006765313|nr:PREDICTED: uncharacterized protein LOC106111599 [Papilio polytes]
MFEFKGDLQNLTTRQLEFISDVLRKHNYVGTAVCIENVGEKGDNYGSQVKRIKVQFGNGKEFKVIAKILPNNMKQNDIVNSIFMNEIIMFNEVLPKFRELQENVDIPEEGLFQYPVCYGALKEIDNEIILIEDLEISNYTMLEKINTLSNDTVKLVLKNIANFHSMSYVLKNKEPQLINKLSESLFDPMFNSKNITQPEVFFDGVIRDFRTMFNTSKYKDITINVMENFVNTWKKLISSDRGTK